METAAAAAAAAAVAVLLVVGWKLRDDRVRAHGAAVSAVRVRGVERRLLLRLPLLLSPLPRRVQRCCWFDLRLPLQEYSSRQVVALFLFLD